MKTHKITTILSLLLLFTLGCQNQAVSESVPPPPHMDESGFFNQAELDQMLAPIALYPDALLSQVLMAATYPLEIVEASRWSKELGLDGESAVEAAQDKDWDISIKALVAFPDLIELMDEQLSWTRRLGDAFLLQEDQVMATIQELRRRSLDEGNLETLDHLVIKEESEVIIVEPRNVEVVYVPYYNTRYVYGDWWWHDYPPIYWHYPHYSYNHIGFHWSPGFRISTRFYFSFCDWHHRSIYVHRHYWHRDRHDIAHRDSHRYHDKETRAWSHDPRHRRGVDYRTEELSRTHDRKSASGVTYANLPTRSKPPIKGKPPLQEASVANKGSSSTTDTSKYSLPSSKSRSKSVSSEGRTTAPSRPETSKNPALSSRTSRSSSASRTTVPSTRSTPSSSSKYSLPSSSRNKSVSTTTPTTTTRPPTTSRSRTITRPPTTTRPPTSSRSTTTRPPTTSRSSTTTRPPTTSRSSTTTRPPTTSRSSTSSRPPTTSRSSTSSSSKPPATRSPSRSSSSGRSTYSPSSSSRSSSSGSSSRSTYTGSSRSTSGSSLGRSSRSSGRPPSSSSSSTRDQ